MVYFCGIECPETTWPTRIWIPSWSQWKRWLTPWSVCFRRQRQKPRPKLLHEQELKWICSLMFACKLFWGIRANGCCVHRLSHVTSLKIKIKSLYLFGGLEAFAQDHAPWSINVDHNTYLESGSGYPWATVSMGSGQPWSHVLSEWWFACVSTCWQQAEKMAARYARAQLLCYYFWLQPQISSWVFPVGDQQS